MARFYELFAGIGLVREAIEPLGWECVYANDFDPKKRAIYSARYPGCEHLDGRDLWDVDPADLPRPVDLIASSFPCIDLSLAGDRRGLAGQHSGAFWAFVRVLEKLRGSGEEPGAVMIENVAGFLSSNKGADFRMAVRALNDLGYRLDAVQITAEYFTPQSRPRLFVLGVRQDLAPAAMVLPESSADEWRRAVMSDPSIRPRPIREMMLGGRLSDQAPLLDDEDAGFSWGVVGFPKLPRRTEDFIDIVDWEGPWWSRERTEKALSEMAPLHRARVREMVERGGRQAATAYRRRRNGKSVYEVRSDGVAGCLRTARGLQHADRGCIRRGRGTNALDEPARVCSAARLRVPTEA